MWPNPQFPFTFTEEILNGAKNMFEDFKKIVEKNITHKINLL